MISPERLCLRYRACMWEKRPSYRQSARNQGEPTGIEAHSIMRKLGGETSVKGFESRFERLELKYVVDECTRRRACFGPSSRTAARISGMLRRPGAATMPGPACSVTAGF